MQQQASARTGTAVEFVNLTKRFGALVANDGVSFAIKSGTIHGIVGENGAGKSTLMSALFGLYRPDEGFVKIYGQDRRIDSPAKAIESGVGMVHQHFMLVERLTALQNIVLGSEDGFWLAGGVGRAREKVEEIQKRYGLPFPLDIIVRELPVGVQQRVEIVKSLYRKASILVLDEPTSVLTPQEVEGLFAVFRELSAEGKTVILITHKLHEIVAVTDGVTVLRQGRVVGTMATRDVTKRSLAEMMVGRKLRNVTSDRKPASVEPRVQVRRLTVLDAGRTARVSNLSFEIKAGEILGIAGVSGNGQTELLSCLAGQVNASEGEIRLGALSWTAAAPKSTLEIKQSGIANVPEDRLRNAVIGRWSAQDNSVLGLQRLKKVPGVGARMYGPRMAEWCRKLMEDNDVRPRDPSRAIGVFSGGNQQKLVIARELATEPEIIIVGQPTRGVDVGAIEAIHLSLMAQRDAGKSILVVSVELEEIMALSDRILVMFEGRSMGELERAEFDEKTIGLMMAGIEKTQATQDALGDTL
jgi:simple sugar transport system ATP-binding protein